MGMSTKIKNKKSINTLSIIIYTSDADIESKGCSYYYFTNLKMK